MRLARFIFIVSAMTLFLVYRWSLYDMLGMNPGKALDVAIFFCVTLLVFSPLLFEKRSRNAIQEEQ